MPIDTWGGPNQKPSPSMGEGWVGVVVMVGARAACSIKRHRAKDIGQKTSCPGVFPSAAARERGVARGLALAERQTKQSTKRMGRDFRGLKQEVARSERTIASFGLAISRVAGIASIAVAAGGGVAIFAKKTFAQLDGLNKIIERLGVNAEAYQALAFAARRSGIATNTFNLALQRFVRRSAEAARGTGEARGAFRERGITLTDNHGRMRDTFAVLNDVADAMLGVADGQDRVRNAQKLFDSEGVAFLNVLLKGSAGIDEMRAKARELGIVMSGETLDAATRLNDQFDNLTETIGTKLKTALINTADAFANFPSTDFLTNFLNSNFGTDLADQADRDLAELLVKQKELLAARRAATTELGAVESDLQAVAAGSTAESVFEKQVLAAKIEIDAIDTALKKTQAAVAPSVHKEKTMSFVREEVVVDDKRITIETGKWAKQAGGSIAIRLGDTLVLVAATGSAEPRDMPFLPLTCEYKEKAYAAGHIPGGFFKREGRPGEKETLTSRLIDRPIRPLFAKDFRCETHVIRTVLSLYLDNDPDILALVSAPAYDPNDFAGGIDSATWNRLNEDPQRPMQNRAVAGQYPPGSVYKAIVAAAGLQEGLVDPNETVYCPGSFRLGHRTYRCWKRSGCPNHLRCMMDISPDMILEAARRILSPPQGAAS